MNFTVFDVETACSRRDSICSIGIIRIENNAVVYKDSMLINPETPFEYFNTFINGITERMVADKPAFPEIWNKISDYFSDTVLVAHNARSMDLCALYRTLERYGLDCPENEYICTMETARKIMSSEQQTYSCKLNDLCERYGVELAHHHDALEDTQACMGLLDYFMRYYPEFVEIKEYTYTPVECRCKEKYRTTNWNCTDETLEMRELQSNINSLMENGLSLENVKWLAMWLTRHRELKGVYPFDNICAVVENVLEDGVITCEEKECLTNLFDDYINPKTLGEPFDINGKKVCLSGDFEHGSKQQVEEILTGMGAVIVGSVSAKTDVLILGNCKCAAWKFENYGSKYEKAKQLQEKGKPIVILKESDILK